MSARAICCTVAVVCGFFLMLVAPATGNDLWLLLGGVVMLAGFGVVARASLARRRWRRVEYKAFVFSVVVPAGLIASAAGYILRDWQRWWWAKALILAAFLLVAFGTEPRMIESRKVVALRPGLAKMFNIWSR